MQTGWGRTGEHFWGYQAHGVVPDMLTFAKGLGNGLAIGGVVARGEIMDCLSANSISTFGGNPLATAGALANLEYLLEHDLQTNASKVGRHLRSAIEDLGDKVDIIGDVRGKGLMIGVELVKTRQPRNPTRRLLRRCWRTPARAGCWSARAACTATALRIAPPLSLTEAEADEGYGILAKAIEKAAKS